MYNADLSFLPITYLRKTTSLANNSLLLPDSALHTGGWAGWAGLSQGVGRHAAPCGGLWWPVATCGNEILPYKEAFARFWHLLAWPGQAG